MRLSRLVVVFALSGITHATAGTLVLIVKDVQARPVPNAELSIDGYPVPALSDRNGYARLTLPSVTKPNTPVVLKLNRSPQNRDLVIIQPWDGWTLVPPFDEDPNNHIVVILADRNNVAILKYSKAVKAVAEQLLKSSAPRDRGEEHAADHRVALAEVAKKYGLPTDEIDAAIRAWGRRTEDPYDKGLAALYEKRYDDATRDLTTSVERREKELAQAKSNFADAAFFLGNSVYEQGKYCEAVAAYERVLPLRPDDPTLINNLALALVDAGDYDRAEPLYRRALAIHEKLLGADHSSVATSLNNLAELFRLKGDYSVSEPLYRRALAIYERSLSPDDPDVAAVMNNLALLLKSKRDYTAAEPLYRRAVAIKEKSLGSDHPSVATSLNNLAELLKSEGNYTAAEPLYRRAIAIKEKSLGTDHPSVATSLNNLAGLLKSKGEYSTAEPLYRRALAIREKSFGPDHARVATILINLAELLDLKGDYTAAEPLHRRALAIKEKSLEPNHANCNYRPE